MADWGSPDNPILLDTVEIHGGHFPDVGFTGSGGGFDSRGFPGWGTNPSSWGLGAGAGGVADAESAAGYPSGTPLGAYFGPGGSGLSGSGGLVPSDQAHYYSGYWAGVEQALYGGGAGIPAGPFHFSPFGPPEVFPFLRPAPDTRQASSGFGAFFAAIAGTIVGPAEASPLDFAWRGEGSPRQEIGGGGDLFATDSNSAGAGRGEPVTSADLAAELVRANTRLAPGAERRWQADFLTEIAYNPNNFFPYGRTLDNLRGAEKFFDINRGMGYPPSSLVSFPVYKQLFGEGTPPLFMGSQALDLSGYPIIWWPMIPYPGY